MKKLRFLFTILFAVAFISLLSVLFTLSASAATEGIYSYTVYNGEATVTGVPRTTSGDIDIPSTLGGYPVTKIGDSAFYWCLDITSITIPDSVTSIGNYAFSGCTELTTMEIPAGVTNIGGYAFSGCTSLSDISIPATVTTIGSCAFANCAGLTAVHISDIAAWCRVGIFLPTDNPLSRAKKLYVNGEQVTDLVIPDGVTSIGQNTFSGYTGLESITMPDSVLNIGANAFSDCTGLTSVTIPGSVTSIGEAAFGGCTGLESISIPFVGNTKDGTSNTHFGWIFGASTYSAHANYVPSSLKTVVVTGGTNIARYAFYDCSGIECITLPFVGGSKDDVENPHFGYIFGSWTYFENTAYVPASLKEVTITGGTSIGENAFNGCKYLTNIYLPDTITEIKAYAFAGCGALAGMNFPQGLTKIGNYAFSYCTSIETMVLPDSLKRIGKFAFEYCESLESITIPSSCTQIDTTPFVGSTFVTIRCYSGSAAHTHALSEGLSYELVYEENTTIPVAPTVESATETSVTLTAQPGYEYKRGNGAWQTSPTFTGLSLNTAYTFYQRVAQTETVAASVTSAGVILSTNDHSFTTMTEAADYLYAPATCIRGAEYHHSCVECGLAGTTTFVSSTVDATNHDFATTWSYGDQTHYHVCTRCNGKGSEMSHTYGAPTSTEKNAHKSICVCGRVLAEACSGGTATCQAKAVCDTCNAEYGQKGAHDFSIPRSNDTHHWMRCSLCNVIHGKSEHTLDADGTCIGCDYGKPEEPDVPETNAPDSEDTDVPETDIPESEDTASPETGKFNDDDNEDNDNKEEEEEEEEEDDDDLGRPADKGCGSTVESSLVLLLSVVLCGCVLILQKKTGKTSK